MIKNNAEFSGFELETIFGKESLFNIDNDMIFKGITIDSREAAEGNIFTALKGEIIDGHTKTLEAIEAGASAAFVERTWYDDNRELCAPLPLIVVPDTEKGLGKIAKYHRLRFDIPIIAVAGSNGKTTTKDIIAAVLEKKYTVLKTHANFNNQLGLPLMLLSLNDSYTAAVLEIGTNEPGEISILSDILAPTAGIITNIGKEHLEKLLDLDGVEMEETYLFGYLLKHNGKAFVNIDDQRLARYCMLLENKLTYGSSTNAGVIGNVTLDKNLHPIIDLKFHDYSSKIKLETTGYTSGLNGLAATAVGFGFGLSGEEIKEALESFKPDSVHDYGRMLYEKIGDFAIINDCYNANPSSTLAALESLSKASAPKKFAVLGDMLELGDSSEGEHIEILKTASAIADSVYITGEEMRKAGEISNLSNVKYIADKKILAESLYYLLQKGDIVLFKGSRGMRMEEVIIYLKKLSVK